MNPPVLHSTDVTLPIGRRPLPGAGDVDVWLMQPHHFPVPPGSGMHSARFRQRFALRLLLGAYLQIPGKDVAVVRDLRGKPGLSPQLAASGLQFSLSHSADWLLLAVGRGHALGVDLEAPRTLRRPAALARRYFCPAEADLVSACAEPLRTRNFLRLWTAKEAVLKAAGTGLAGYINQVEIALDAAGTRLAAVPQDWRGDPWQLAELPLPTGLIGHLASPGALQRIALYRLS